MTVTTATEPTFAIADVAERTGVSAHALRYYERIGLLDVGRQGSGHRRYTDSDVGRVVFITRLRATAMPIREIQRYFALVALGPSTAGAACPAGSPPSRGAIPAP